MARASRIKNICVSISSCAIDFASGGRFIFEDASRSDIVSVTSVEDSMLCIEH